MRYKKKYTPEQEAKWKQKRIKRHKQSALKLSINQKKQNSPNERRFRYMLKKNKVEYIW